MVTFHSAFEGGNLDKAEKIRANTYALTLCKDQASPCAYWFCFRVEDVPAQTTVRFEICNVTKDTSLFGEGALPYVRKASASREDWNPVHGEAEQRKTMVVSEDDGSLVWNTQYTLSFAHTFDDDESCIFAPSIPYTYSDMLKDVDMLEMKLSSCVSAVNVKREKVCRTLSTSRNLEMIKFARDGARSCQGLAKTRVVITCRVHPSETVCSWVLRGFFKFICGQSREAEALLDACEFWVFPMLNPDGVAKGLHRGSIASRDLNREWDNPSSGGSPTILAAKRYIADLHEEQGVDLFCDLHGHSTCHGSFLYGNSARPSKYNASERVPPRRKAFMEALGDVGGCLFSKERCRFNWPRYAAARKIMFEEMSIEESFTLETSVSGYHDENHAFRVNTVESLERMGKAFGLGLFQRFIKPGRDHDNSGMT